MDIQTLHALIARNSSDPQFHALVDVLCRALDVGLTRSAVVSALSLAERI